MFYVALSAQFRGALERTLAQLEQQSDRDFQVILLDPGWHPEVDDLLNHSSLKIHRIHYRSPLYPRRFDWGMWNSAALVTESEDDRLFRLQAFRVIPRNCIAELKRLRENVCFARTKKDWSVAEQVDYTKRHVAFEPQHTSCLENNGDWCLRVGDLIYANGIDEPFTSRWHCEDVEMGRRWKIAQDNGLMQNSVVVNDFLIYMDDRARERMGYVMRNDTTVLTGTRYDFLSHYTPPCPRCRGGWDALQATNDQNVRLADLSDSEDMADLGVQWGKRWFVCGRCHAPVSQLGAPHFAVDHQGMEYRATLGLAGKYGRDLRVARAIARNLPMRDRLPFIVESYVDPCVHFDYAPYRARSMFNGLAWGLLDDVLEHLPRRGLIVELGCHKAGLSGYIARRHPNRDVIAVDRFEGGLPEPGPRDMAVSASYHEGVMSSSYEEVSQWLRREGGQNVLAVRADVTKAVTTLAPRIALAIVDLNLYEPTKAALRWLWPRLEPGGWCLMDDPEFPGVKAAMEESLLPWLRRQGMATAQKPSIPGG